VGFPTNLNRVRAVKQEYAEYGGDPADEDEFGGVPIEPSEDAVEASGVVLQYESSNDENVGIWRDSNGNMVFIDSQIGTDVTLSDLAGEEATSFKWRHHFLLMGA
jgi:hypothetical protein